MARAFGTIWKFEMGKFRLSFNYRFEAAHRFTMSCADSCATPHGHTWRARAVFESEESALGEDDMILEFSSLKSSWKKFIQDTVDHSFMHHYEDPILSSLRTHIPKFRGLPFPGDPTTELISVLFLAKLQAMNKALPNAPSPVSVIIKETPTNTVSIRLGDNAVSSLIEKLNQNFFGWWQDADPAARYIERKSKI